MLVVDDERLVRWSIGETLSAIGYDVFEAADGDAAILALGDPRSAIDIVLLDLYLPDSDDLRVLGAMRRIAPGTPVILMTGYGSPELFDRALRLGAVRVVSKPFDIGELVPLIEDALENEHTD